MRVKTLPVFLAFFLMGLAEAMGPMSDGVKKQYELSNLVATLLPLLMGWFMDFGWKATAFIVPVLSFAYLVLLSLQRGRRPTAALRSQQTETMKA